MESLFFSYPTGELWLYHSFADHLMNGQIPYADFFPEYPIFSLLFFLLPRLIINDPIYYRFGFYILILLFLGLGIYLINKLRGNYILFFGGALALGGLLWDRFDLFPAVLSLLAVSVYLRKWKWLGYLILGVGILTKIYPIVLLPLFLIKDRGWFTNLLLITLFLVVGFGSMFVLGREGFSKFIEFQGNRGTHLESGIGSIKLLEHYLLGKEIKVVYEHNAYEIR